MSSVWANLPNKKAYVNESHRQQTYTTSNDIHLILGRRKAGRDLRLRLWPERVCCRQNWDTFVTEMEGTSFHVLQGNFADRIWHFCYRNGRY